MIKITIFSLFVTFSLTSQSIVFETIGETDSLIRKEVLFNRLNSKLIEIVGGQANYDNSIIQSDKEQGIIKFKQQLNYVKSSRSDSGFIKYTVNVFFRDGKYKIIFDDFFHNAPISLMTITVDEEYPHEQKSWLRFRKKAWKEIKSYINAEIPVEISSIEKIIKSPTELEKDW